LNPVRHFEPRSTMPGVHWLPMGRPHELTIRELRPRDVRPLVAIAEEAFSTEQAAFGSDARRLAREGRFMAWVYPLQRLLPRPMTIALTGIVGGKPVGRWAR